MSIFLNAFNILLYQPLLNLLVLLYLFIPGQDLGVAIIVLTFLIRFLFYPLSAKAIKNQKAITEIQPKVKEIQQKYKDNKEQQAKELMELYKREKINPFSGFAPLLIQLPVLIALYRVFWNGLSPEQLTNLYSFVPVFESVNPMFLGLLNLSAASLPLAFLAGIFQYIQAKMSIAKTSKKQGKQSDFSNIMQKQMQYFFPIMTVLILFKLPAAIGIYWVTTTLFSIGQQYILLKKNNYDRTK